MNESDDGLKRDRVQRQEIQALGSNLSRQRKTGRKVFEPSRDDWKKAFEPSKEDWEKAFKPSKEDWEKAFKPSKKIGRKLLSRQEYMERV